MQPRQIPTDPLLIRAFILHDVLLEKPISKGFQDMCKIVPEFDQSEYKFYYDHFLAGSLDLNVVYSPSADPTPRRLDELPSEILEMILEPLDVKNRYTMRQVSKTMLAVVEKLNVHYDYIFIVCDEGTLSIYVTVDNYTWQKEWNVESARENNMEIDHHLKTIFKPTKIRVKRFEIFSRISDLVKKVIESLESIANVKNAKLHVETGIIAIRQYDLAKAVLSLLKPTILEYLSVGTHDYDNDLEIFDLTQYNQMEQFNNAKTIELFGLIEFPVLSLLSNIEEFHVEFVQSIRPEDVLRLREDLSNSITFKKCTILSETALGYIVARALGAEYPDERTIHVIHEIANSEDALHFSIHSYQIDIEKGDRIELEAKYKVEEQSDDESELSDDNSDFDVEEEDHDDSNSSDEYD